MKPGHVIVLLITVSGLQAAAGADPGKCSDLNRFGKSLQHVEPPLSCQRSPGSGGGATWCDTPGTDYPWQEIRDYLRRSSEEVSKRTGQFDPGDIQRLLTKYGIANTRIASPRRKGRSADVTGTRDVTSQQLVREAGRVTSRSGGWEEESVASATEATNFELRNESQDGSRSGSVKPASKRINDKDLSEEDELVLLLTYFTNPNNIVFTESVLQGILSLTDSFGNGDEHAQGSDATSSQDTSSSDPHPQGSQHVAEEQNKKNTKASKPADASPEHTADQLTNEQNGTLAEQQNGTLAVQQPATNTSADAINNPDEASQPPQATHQPHPGHVPSPTAPKRPLSPTATPTRHPASTSTTPAATSTTTPSSSFPDASSFPDTQRRHPAPSGAHGAIPAETRTGEDVLAEIRTGDDILADITGEAGTTGYRKGEPHRHHDWTWDDAQPGDWTQEDEDAWNGKDQDAWNGKDQDVWTDQDQDAWTDQDQDQDVWTDQDQDQDAWTDGSKDAWSDEAILPEVQYYRPTTPPTGRPDAADAFEWHDSPVAEWRPMPAPPPQADSLIARLPERAPQQGEKDTEEGERVVMEYGQRMTTTSKPVTAGSTAADLTLFEETVYTNAIYRPDEQAQVSQTVAMTTATTLPPVTLSPTTLDPYVVSACQTSVEIRSPFYAMNTQNIWKMLINIPPFETYIHMEHCVAEHEQGLCAAGCRCTQRQMVRTMPVYVRDANGCDRIYMDKFLFPSHCDCMCLPLHHVLFNLTRPAPTTPATSTSALDNSTLLPGPEDGAAGETAPPGGQRENSTLPMRVTDGASAEAMKAAGLVARVVTAAPTPSPASRRAPGPPPRTPPPRRPVVPADSLIRSHRNRNRGPAFPSPLHHRSSTDSVTRRNGRSGDTPRQNDRYDEVPRPLPRR